MNCKLLIKSFVIILVLSTQFFWSSTNVQAQYVTTPSSTLNLAPSCTLVGNNPQMRITWADSAPSNSWYEIWRSDGTIRQAGNGLIANYYANQTLTGSPLLTRTDPQVDFPWGAGSPSAAVSADGDNFSVNWEGLVEAPVTDTYTFYMDVSDGAKLLIDGNTLINKLSATDNNLKTFSGTVAMTAGSRHNILVQYAENTGVAEVHLSWSYTGQTKIVIPTQRLYTTAENYTVVYPSSVTPKSTADGLRGYYYTNNDLLGGPILERLDTNFNNNWGAGSPDPLVPSDNFSIRWSGQVLAPNTGDYTFFVNVNDGTRLYIDGIKVIDKWNNRSNASEFNSTLIKLGANTKHNIVLEYFEETGNAEVQLRWQGPSITKVVIPPANLFSSSVNQNNNSLIYNASGGLTGHYYNNPDFSNQPVIKRVDSNFNMNWGAGSPDPLVPSDNFSIRWSGQVLAPNTGDYTFFVNVNDGTRLYIDGVSVIDQWGANATEFSTSLIKFAANSRHTISLDYYDSTGNAEIQLKWQGPSIAKAVIPPANLYSTQYAYIDTSGLQPSKAYKYSIVTHGIQQTVNSPWSIPELTPPCGAVAIDPNPEVSCNIKISWQDNTGSSRFGVYRAEAVPSVGFSPDSSGNLASGLLSYWGFNEQGNTIIDNKGLNNGVTFGTTSIGGLRAGLARLFNGTSDYIRIDAQGSNPNLNLTKNFTIAGWINPSAVSGTKGIITKLVDDTNIQFALSVDGGKLQFDYDRNNNNFKVRGGTIEANKMQFVAVTVSNSTTPTVNIFVGDPTNAVDTGVAVETLANSNPIELGRWSNYTNRSFSGTMDEMGIWGSALTPQELTDLYNGGLANPYTPGNDKVSTTQINNNWPSSPYLDSPLIGKKYAYQVSAYDATGVESAFSNWTNPVNYLTSSCAPDLVSNVQGLLYSPNAGLPVPFTGIVQNIQRGNAIASSARFCIDDNSCSVNPPGASRIGGADVATAALQYGQSTTVISPDWIAVLGNHTVYMCVDVQKVTGDLNLTNNCSSYPFTVENTRAWIQTTEGDVHTNGIINVGGPP